MKMVRAVGHVGQRVAGGVRRTDLDQLDHASTDLDVEPAVERARRQAHVDAVELEVTEEPAEQVADVALGLGQPGEHRRRHLGHLVRCGRGGDDLGAVDELVAVAVVAVGVGVDQRGDRGGVGDRRHRLEHPPGEAQVEQRVDEQRRARRRRPGRRCSIPIRHRAADRRSNRRRARADPSCNAPSSRPCGGSYHTNLHAYAPSGTTRGCRVRQLSGIDVSFLNMETHAVFGHVSSLNIYDPTGAPGGAGIEATKRILLERIDQLEPFRRRLVEVPFGLDNPYWIEDPAFDIDFHVRHHAVPPPGNPEQLAEVVTRIVARPLDRDRPLWELYVIEGVDDGRLIAQLTKVHHATIDGASGATMLSALLDDGSGLPSAGHDAGAVDPRADADRRRAAAAHGAELLRRPEKLIRLTVRAVRELAASSRIGRPARPRRHDRPADAWSGGPGDPTAAARPDGQRHRPTAGAAHHPGAAHSVERARHPAPPLRLHHGVARRRQDHPPRVRLHVQRRRDGAVLGHAAPLPAGPRLPAGRTADRHGARQRAHRRRDRHVPEPGVGAARRSGDERGRSGEAAAPRAGEHDVGQGGLQGDPRRDAAGLRPVRSAGRRRPGDADVQPAAHRRPDEPAVQPDHLQRARSSDAAVLRRGTARSTSTRSARSPTARA